MKRWSWVIAMMALVAGVLLPWVGVRGADLTPAELRAAYQKGNYKDAYDGLAPRVLAEAGTDNLRDDFNLCLNALNNLGRTDEIDDFREKAVAAHPKDWQFLQTVAQSYRDQQHFGVIIAGTFKRGTNRNGDGKWVTSLDRDRIRALQLMGQAAAILQGVNNPPVAAAAQFYYQYADILLLGDNGPDAWRLQTLTDLTTLPDYEETASPYYYRGYYGYQPSRGAPVDNQGNPILHQLPKGGDGGGWAAAKTDGERWRWVMLQASELSPAEAVHAKFMWASFLESQFGVATMAEYGALLRAQAEDGKDGKKDESGPFAVFTLKDGETIAKLANGIKRFALPDEFNPIVQFQQVAESRDDSLNLPQQAMAQLAGIYANRQQYNTAADWWRKDLARFVKNSDAQQQLDQIVGNWGMFESSLVQPAGDVGAKLDFRFRNGNAVSFAATEIDIPTLLADVKAHILANPNRMDPYIVNINEIGYRLVQQNETKYLQGAAVMWDLPLTPRADHFDKRITVETPLKKPGAYLVTATMANGNTTRIVAWVTDTVIVEKPMDGKTLTYVADAVTGKAIGGATLDYFGYRQVWLRDQQYRLDTQSYTGTANGDGELMLPVSNQNDQLPVPAIDPANPVLAPNMQWLTIATTKEGRYSFSGFNYVWRGQYFDQYDQQYNQTKAYIMTDRPVYRPEQKISFKMWVGNNKYDQDGKNPHAGQPASILVHNPRGEMIKEVSGQLDEFGGLVGELTLDKNAPLGVYSINSPGLNGGISFRLEEYKKPEFEVKIDAPTEPVMLGEKVPATITAKYYFGSPVTQATVKYKVTRVANDARWFPAAYWDWYYEPGYWWFAADYVWYPGFSRWGMLRPMHAWYGGWSPEQPEVISENEVPIGADGTVKIEIDTAVAKAAYGDQDHKYTITAEVTDASRRTITGTGDVLVARDPFKVYAWVDKGHYQVGETVHASFSAQTLDNKPVPGKGMLRLLAISYDAKGTPSEKEMQTWNLNTDDQGKASVQINAEKAGQYRLAYTVTDAKNHTIEGGYIFLVRGAGDGGGDFRFNDIEVVTDKKEYAPGDKVKLAINANRADATVLLFVRPANGVYTEPKVIHMVGKSAVEEVTVEKKDMPNFFIEALTISDAKVHTEVREVIVPPEDRVLNVAVSADKTEYKPGEKAKLTVRVTETNGEPFSGAAVLSLYDKAVEYISGGPNAPDIRKFFWQWRRTHSVNQTTSLEKSSAQVLKNGETGMQFLGVFGALATEYGEGFDTADKAARDREDKDAVMDRGRSVAFSSRATYGFARGGGGGGGAGGGLAMDEVAAAMPAAAPGGPASSNQEDNKELRQLDQQPGNPPGVEPTVRTNFADTALWAPQLVTATNGTATVEVTMPENLTKWVARVWSYGNGSHVGQADTDVVTRKNLIVRLEAPRFFVQTDQVVLSSIVHNYLKTAKDVQVQLQCDGGTLESLDAIIDHMNGPLWSLSRKIRVEANGEARVDWRVHAVKEGTAQITMKAITDEESDAMQMSFPVYVHGMLKTESFAGALRPNPDNPTATVSGLIKMTVPTERRPEQTLLEVRYSPSLASAMVDALPYMVDYPYGCTEQTLNRFVPTVITQKVLLDMKLDLAAIQAKRTNLNAQEIGDPTTRAARWAEVSHFDHNPVFDVHEVENMVKDGVGHLAAMQLSDGGWGWFSGTGEASFPHTTAVVVHGLQQAAANGAYVDSAVIARGVQWLVNYQKTQLAWIQAKRDERKAGDIDAFVYMVLVDAGQDNKPMREIIYEDRNGLQVYTKAMFGLAMIKVQDKDKLAMMLQNCKQFLVQDDENQTAYLKLPPNMWYYWYGSEFEAHAYYLKLLAATDPKGQDASRLAKYLINNRKNATYWSSTRDTAICIEALADYIRASGEDRPDMTVHIALDGKLVKTEKITAENLFSYDNRYAIEGALLTDGPHTVEISRDGTGPLYYNSYLTNFTMENHITKAGLEIKVTRKVYKLTEDDKTVKTEGDHGQAVDKRVEKYIRTELADGETVNSGDLIEVELQVDSKNDYEYILIQDMKAAGFEPVEVQSGYTRNDMGAYVEYRDERVSFFVRELGRGTHSVSYRLRAEIPGSFSALPTKASAMYAPELRANSDEIKLRIEDKPAAR